MRGNSHVRLLGVRVGAIPSGYPIRFMYRHFRKRQTLGDLISPGVNR
jgi:hypothetical protein